MSTQNYIVTCNDDSTYDVIANCPSHARLRAFFQHKRIDSNISRKDFDATIVSVELKEIAKI